MKDNFEYNLSEKAKIIWFIKLFGKFVLAGLLLIILGIIVSIIYLPIDIFNYVFVFIFLFIVGTLLAIVYIHLYHKNYKYIFKEKEFVIEYGIIFKTRVIIPYQKVQNVNIYYDPLHKLLGTAKVIINTAATDVSLSEYVLEAIDYPDELVRYIMDKVEGNKHYKRRLAE